MAYQYDPRNAPLPPGGGGNEYLDGLSMDELDARIAELEGRVGPNLRAPWEQQLATASGNIKAAEARVASARVMPQPSRFFPGTDPRIRQYEALRDLGTAQKQATEAQAELQSFKDIDARYAAGLAQAQQLNELDQARQVRIMAWQEYDQAKYGLDQVNQYGTEATRQYGTINQLTNRMRNAQSILAGGGGIKAFAGIAEGKKTTKPKLTMNEAVNQLRKQTEEGAGLRGNESPEEGFARMYSDLMNYISQGDTVQDALKKVLFPEEEGTADIRTHEGLFSPSDQADDVGSAAYIQTPESTVNREDVEELQESLYDQPPGTYRHPTTGTTVEWDGVSITKVFKGNQ
jgi:hypothetical protein